MTTKNFKYQPLFAIVISFAVAPMHANAEGGIVYPDGVQFSQELKVDGDVKKCELFFSLIKLPEMVAMRLFTMSNGKRMFMGYQVDLAAYRTVSNGIPYDLEKKAITSADIVSNIFDSTKSATKMDYGDGGIGYTIGTETLPELLTTIRRGDYLVGFKRKDKADRTVYAVKQTPPDDVMNSYLICARNLAASTAPLPAKP